MKDLASRIRKIGLDEIYAGDDRLADEEEQTRRFDRRTQDLEELSRTQQVLTAESGEPSVSAGEEEGSDLPQAPDEEEEEPEATPRRLPGWFFTVLALVVLAGLAALIWYLIKFL